MGGLAIKLDMFQSLALAVIAIWLGNWCRQKFPFLRKYCLPGAVVGGTIISLISLVLYETGVAELSFDYKVANSLFYCIFFAASGAAAQSFPFEKGWETCHHLYDFCCRPCHFAECPFRGDWCRHGC